tara:strand:- start:427 stop:678 length:252 start_codon:yes stop_codon:yes gene_type:complete
MKDIQGIDCFGKLHPESWVTVITNDHEGGFEYEYNMSEYDEWYSIDDEPITWENEIFHLITASQADNYTILEVYANDTKGEIL